MIEHSDVTREQRIEAAEDRADQVAFEVARERGCPWCGHPDDCLPGIPGKSPHHRRCCADRTNPACIRTEREALNRIMRDDNEREVS